MDTRPVNQDDFEHLSLGSSTTNSASSTPNDLKSRSPAEDPFLKYSEDPPALIAVMGVTGSGKTTFVNLASKSCLRVGKDLRSCTSEVQESEVFVLDGRKVVIIDTPGFDDTHASDTDVLKSIAEFLGESYSAGTKLAGVIYVHRISDDRFGGIAVKNFRMFRELCGEKTLKNVVLMTNMWGRVTPEDGLDREQQLRDDYLQAAIAKGAQLYRHNNTPESAQVILRKILENEPVTLRIQRELIDERKDIRQTGAGAELNREINEVVEKYQEEIKEMEENVRKAIEDKDEETREKMEEGKRKMQEEMEKLQKDSEDMQPKFEEARREMEERINTRHEAQVKQIQETQDAVLRDYEDRMKKLEEDRQKNASQIKSLERETRELHHQAEEWRPCTIM